MNSARGFRLALAGGVALSLAAASIAVTLTPTTHNFGKAAIRGGAAFTNFTVAGLPIDDSASFNLSGANPGDFAAPRVCGALMGTTACSPQVIYFRPTSLGPKNATLVVTDRFGNRASAQLSGEGVGVLCTNEVVFCNFAHLYSGSFSWHTTLRGPGGANEESVTVTVVKGVATCDGTVTVTDPSGTYVQSIKGPGLIAVQFTTNATNQLMYLIKAACPSPRGVGDPPAEPARMSSHKTSHEVTATAPGMALVGSWSIPAPEADPLNGVSGTSSVSWSLKQ